ncbi:MAG: carboxypeptidase regulatory-like domain-containing protein [Ignavibacteriota bacterium]
MRDASHSVLSKAAVTLTSLETAISTKTTTDGNGEYDFLNVKVGRYTLAVEAAGFAKSTTDVAVDVEARQRVDITMQVGGVTDSVTVSGAVATLDTDNSEHSQVVNTTAIVELPLNGRNYADLALLSTNAIKSPIAVSFAASGTPREGSFNVNGMRSTYNNFMLDGVDNNSYGTSNQGYSSQLSQPSPDSLSEFKVITGTFSAEYGRVGGAVVNAAMKAGTNEFHGSAWEFLRNTDLNATGFLFSPAVFVKPTLQRNQFGATIGGPHRSQPGFLLRRLRRLPPVAALSEF